MAALLLVTGHASGEAGEPLVFAGSGSSLSSIRLLVAAFTKSLPDVRIQVPASIGSTGAVRAAADGAVSAGLISRPLRGPERQLGLTVVPYASTAVVIGVHPGVPDEDITGAELVQVYRGTRTRWRDGREILVLTREPGDSAIEVLEQEVSGFRDAYVESQAARRWMVVFTDQEMNARLAATPSALGLSDAGAIATERLAIKALRFDGVAPTAENVRAGRYRLVKTLAVVFGEDRLPAGARRFLEFLRSREARRLLTEHGYVPVE